MPIYRLSREYAFPPPALAEKDGLLAVGGDLSEQRLLLAYEMGIFPWYSDDSPILWWSPDPRMVLFPNDFHVSRRLQRVLRSGRFRVTADTAFREVIAACAEPQGPARDGTWITSEMQEAYTRLHDAGWAHSFETWRDDALVGGLYGVSLGGVFFGESMFHRTSDASKAAAATLAAIAHAWRFQLIDCQVANPHLERLGAREIARERFLHLLAAALRMPTRHGSWTQVVEETVVRSSA